MSKSQKEVRSQHPGISRKKTGNRFAYFDSKGRCIRNKTLVQRLDALRIPPAWTEVWISPDLDAQLIATGRDAKGRKQYRYHPHWRERQDKVKYNRILEFGKHLPKIRRQALKDLKKPGLSREKVLAAIVLLLERTRIRVGNEEYARSNKSFGLTTLQDKHASIQGASIKFRFRGKSGKDHDIEIHDRSIAPIVKACRELLGTDLFQFVDEEGVTRDIVSADVNAYLRSITSNEFSAKDFRTWAGTVLAAMALQEFERVDSKAAAKRYITRAIESVAKELGNTPSICKSCYVHPAIIESYLDGSFAEILQGETRERLKAPIRGLSAEEGVVLAFLEARLRARNKIRGRRNAGGRTTLERKSRGPVRSKLRRRT